MTTYIVSFLMLAIIAFISYSIRNKIMFQKKCQKVFDDVYEESLFSPEYKFGTSYWYPSFKVIFESDRELNSAHQKGLNKRFSESIEELCKDVGDKKNPFEAERAIWFTSKEDLEAIQKKYG